MAKLLKFDNDAEYYYNRGLEKSEGGFYIEAVDSFYAALDREPDNLWIYSEIAYNYLELGLNGEALKIYYRILSIDKKADIGYLGIIQCFIRDGQLANALFYLNMGMENGVLDHEILPEMSGFLGVTEYAPLKVLDKNDNSDMLNLARKMILGGENEYAKQMLEGIPTDSKQYGEARGYLAHIACDEGNYDESLKIADEVLAGSPTDVGAITTAMSACRKKGDAAGYEKYARMLDGLTLSKRNELYRASVSVMQSGDDERAEKYLGLLFDDKPYDRDATLGYALALYNVGKFKEARAYMLALRRLYPDDSVIGYYARFVGEGKIKRIPPSFDLPEGERKRRVLRIEEILSELGDVDRVAERLDDDEEFYDMIMWLFSSDEYGLSEHVGAFLCQHEAWQPFFLDKLADPDVPASVKKEYLLSYLRYSDDKKFALLVGDVMLFFSPRIPKCDDSFDMRECYWAVFATCAFVATDFPSKINKTYKKLVSIMSEPDFKPFKIDVPTMSAVITYLSRVHDIFARKTECCEIFGCDPELFDEYLRKLTASEKRTKKDASKTEE